MEEKGVGWWVSFLPEQLKGWRRWSAGGGRLQWWWVEVGWWRVAAYLKSVNVLFTVIAAARSLAPAGPTPLKERLRSTSPTAQPPVDQPSGGSQVAERRAAVGKMGAG